MLNINSLKLGSIPKVFLILVPWALAILAGGFIQQNMSAPTIDGILTLWAIVTVVGLIGQGLGLCKGLELNFGIWVAVIALGWIFTFFVFKIYNPGEKDLQLFNDIAPFWLLMTAIGFAATALQVSKLFWIAAGVHLLLAFVFELNSRGILKSDFLNENQALLFGLVDGGVMLVAVIVAVVLVMRPAKTQTAPQRA